MFTLRVEYCNAKSDLHCPTFPLPSLPTSRSRPILLSAFTPSFPSPSLPLSHSTISPFQIGYGDFSPKTESGRAFFVCWAILGIANMTILVSGSFDVCSFPQPSLLTSNDERISRKLDR